MMNTPTKIKYLLDANVLIGFSLWKPIALNLNNDFWSKFGDALARGEWVLLDVVVKEIKYYRDLMKWCQEKDKKGLVKKISDNNKSRGVEINNQYKMINETTLKSTVDTYLIAYAEANNLGVFSRESPRINSTFLYKIPDVCEILNIKWIKSPKFFLKEIGFD